MAINKNRPSLYVFQWISELGGADTRLKELLILLSKDYAITCIPNDAFRLKEKENTDFLDSLSIKYCMASDLPKKLDGFAYSNCNFRIFTDKDRINFIKDSGLIFIWSNDMMWTKNEELDEIRQGKVDCVLFTSHFHKNAIGPAIFEANPNQKTAILENYFDADRWPYIARPNKNIVTCGKVSRADTLKFSENFPIFYESATKGLPVNYSVMGWSDRLQSKYSWHNFSDRWLLMPPNTLKTQDWYSSIDLFLYDCSHLFQESQGRTIIEAQLTGCPVLAPKKWNFPNMVWNERTGVLWDTLEELQEEIKAYMDYEYRTEKGRLASEFTREIWCNASAAKRNWNSILNSISNK